tara:strand:- start:382 stop:558 length:177 start_codon:yes stop_codon:yes gene_type:complete
VIIFAEINVLTPIIFMSRCISLNDLQSIAYDKKPRKSTQSPAQLLITSNKKKEINNEK